MPPNYYRFGDEHPGVSTFVFSQCGMPGRIQTDSDGHFSLCTTIEPERNCIACEHRGIVGVDLETKKEEKVSGISQNR